MHAFVNLNITLKLNAEIKQYQNNILVFDKVSVIELLDEMQTHPYFILFVGRESCPFCRQFASVFSNPLTTDADFNNTYTDTDILLKTFRGRYKVDSVPSVMIFNGLDFYFVDLNQNNNAYNEAFIKQTMLKDISYAQSHD